MEKTNDVLDRVRADLTTLIAWAEADCDASKEADAKDQAQADGRRANRYRAALAALEGAHK